MAKRKVNKKPIPQSIQIFISEQLKIREITLKEFNRPKYKEDRYSIVYRAMLNLLRDNPEQKYTKEQSVQIVRDTGLQFSNEFGRDTYSELKDQQKRSKYGANLRSNFKPKHKNVGKVTKDASKYINRFSGSYLYGATLYLSCSNPQKSKSKNKRPLSHRKMKSNVIKLGSEGYNNTADIVFIADELLTKSEVNDIFYKMINHEDVEELYSSVSLIGSDYAHILNSKDCHVIGFRYSRLIYFE